MSASHTSVSQGGGRSECSPCRVMKFLVWFLGRYRLADVYSSDKSYGVSVRGGSYRVVWQRIGSSIFPKSLVFTWFESPRVCCFKLLCSLLFEVRFS